MLATAVGQVDTSPAKAVVTLEDSVFNKGEIRWFDPVVMPTTRGGADGAVT
jgi:hypothetical protein